MRSAIFSALLLTIAITAAGNETVAIVDGVTITRTDMVCGPLLSNRPAGCHRAEQAQLDRLIIDRWIDAASRSYNITLTPAEQAVVEAKVTEGRPIAIRSSERFLALTAAILRIRHGEDASTVYHEAEQHGIKAWELDQQAWLLPTLKAAETAARKHYVAEAEGVIRAGERRRLIARHIKELIRQRAVASGSTLRDATNAFWSDVAASTHTRIVDTTFTLPAAEWLISTVN